MSEPPSFQPLTAQLGDVTYAGEWTIDNSDLVVRSAHGERRARRSFRSRPDRQAETLLVGIYQQAGKL